MKRYGILLLVALAIVPFIVCGCMAPASPSSGPAQSSGQTPAAPLTIAINATPPRYNPAMSSTVGIRLTPINTSGIIPPGAQYIWQTNFGTFYRWGPPDFKVVELAPKFTGTADPVYWSNFLEQGEKERQPVNIILTVTEASTGKIIANATLHVGWEEPLGFTAIVEG